MIGDSSDVRMLFDEALVEKFKHLPDVLQFLKTHERKKICVDNLCAEIIRMNGRKLLIELETFKMVIKDTAYMFAKKALQKAEEDTLSSVERIRRQTEADRIKNAQEVLHELEKDGVVTKIETQSRTNQ
jgi:hypothetical protein